MRKIVPLLGLFVLCFSTVAEAQWSEPVEVRHDDKLVLTYRAKLEGDHLVVRAAIEPGWHTFVMVNKEREKEKLAGKPSLGVEKSTEITPKQGLTIEGPWRQSAPKDFSQPELRHFSWGFEKEATFAAKARRTGSGPAEVEVTGQACAAEICKNIEITLAVPPAKGKAQENLSSLIPVRK